MRISDWSSDVCSSDLDAATHLRIDPDVIEKLKYPKEMLAVRLMIRMDDGSRRSFLAWRCRYDDTRGPTKGGIRFHPQASADERSEERRVGKEVVSTCRSGWSSDHIKKKTKHKPILTLYDTNEKHNTE